MSTPPYRYTYGIISRGHITEEEKGDGPMNLSQLAGRLTNLHADAGIEFIENGESVILCLETPMWVTKIPLTLNQVAEIRTTVVDATAHCSITLAEAVEC